MSRLAQPIEGTRQCRAPPPPRSPLEHPVRAAGGSVAASQRRGASNPRAIVGSWPRIWFAAAVVLVLSLPALGVGFFYDDWIHRLALDQSWSGYARDVFSVYEFNRGLAENRVLMDVGLHPWFASPSLQIRFFRPLSSLLVALDLRILGAHPLVAHLHSMFWFGGVVAVVWKLFHLLTTPR